MINRNWLNIVIVIYIFISACKGSKDENLDSGRLEIPLTKISYEQGEGSQFRTYYENIYINSFEEKYPGYYTTLTKQFKELPKTDSTRIVSSFMHKSKFFYELLNNGHYGSIEEKKNMENLVKDSNSLVKSDYEYMLNVLSVFKNGKHEITADRNHNFDFRDDKTISYYSTFDFENPNVPNSKIVDTIKPIEISYQISENKKLVDVKRKVQLFPYANYLFSQFSSDEDAKKHGLMLRLKDYWMGEQIFDNEKYSFTAQGLSQDYINFVIQPSHFLKYQRNEALDASLRYYISDTVLISKNLYTIDSIILASPKLYLTKLDFKKNKFEGFRLGNYLPDYNFENLEEEDFSISTYGDKDFILLNFWGTWCLPCKELLPRLKMFEANYSNKLNIVGIAFKDKYDVLKEYVAKENINWVNTLKMERTGIIRDMKINSYPTYILLNKELKIIYIGTSKEALDAIEEILKE